MNAPPILNNRYRILTKLGESRLAQVYRAVDERLQRPVLVHLLRPELQATLRERFAEEAQRSAQRSHAGLLEVFDTGEVGNRPFMVTENVEGVPLVERLPLGPSQAVAVLRTIVGAVALAQTQNAPHPPISSRNVWLLEGGRAVLLENWQLSPRDAALDGVSYRAPERAQGGPLTPTATVYALGILAWETLAGRRPFVAVPTGVAAQQAPLPRLAEVLPDLWTPGLDRIVAQAAAASPALRYPSPTDFGRALDLFVDGSTAQTGRLGLLNTPRTRPGRDTQLFAAVPATRRGSTAAQVALPPPPPPAVIKAPPPPRRVTPVPAPAPAPAQPVLDQKALDAAVERAMHKDRQQQRRTGVRRSLGHFMLRLLLVLLLAGGVYLGGGYLYNTIRGYVSGQVDQFNPRAWLVRQLPDWSWVDRFTTPNVPLPSLPDLSLPDVPLVTTYRVVATLNLRNGPGTDAAIIERLAPDTVLRALGERREAQGYEWIRVATEALPPQTGWVANLPESLVRE